MSFVRSRPLALLAALTFSIAACGGSDKASGPSDTGDLSPAEVADALSALSAIGFIGGGLFGAQADLPAGLALQSGSQSFNQTEDCPAGGNMRLQGTISYNQTGSFSVDLRQTHNNCKAPSETGRVWTFNGSPNLRIQLSSSAAAASFNGSITGGFRYTSDGSSGSCAANLQLNFNQAGAGTATGTMCGVNVNESY
jgi:hypothetical protein